MTAPENGALAPITNEVYIIAVCPNCGMTLAAPEHWFETYPECEHIDPEYHTLSPDAPVRWVVAA